MEPFKHLLRLKKTEHETLKEEISKNGKRGFVLVHPYYGFQTDKDYAEHSGYVKNLENLFKRKEPLILLEEPEDLPIAIAEIRRINPLKRIYVVPTDLPYAVLNDWNPLIEKLKELKIKKIHIGGRKLGYVKLSDIDPLSWTMRVGTETLKRYEEKWLPERFRPIKKIPVKWCVGNAYYNLVNSGKFEMVRLMPNLCSPGKRRTLRGQ